MSLLEIQNLSIEFQTLRGRLRAVDKLSLELKEGESLGIVGESGCGKSLTSLAMMGLLPKEAQVSIDKHVCVGQNMKAASEKSWQKLRQSDIAMIFQDPMSALNPSFTVEWQMTECLEPDSILNHEKKCLELLELVRIEKPWNVMKSYPHQLSGGMCQRVMIAMAMAKNPKILIADEPTTALDVTVQSQILKLIKQIQNEKKMGLILVTHDIGVVKAMTDRLLVMYAGQKVEEGATVQVIEKPRHPYTHGLLRCLPSRQIKSGPRSRIPTIPGWVPDLVQRPKGCLLNPRCSRANDRCRTQDPDFIATSGHGVRCFDPIEGEFA